MLTIKRNWPAAILAVLVSTTLALADDKPASKPRKKVLVELYTSQGCNSCPSANEFLGEFTKLGYGADEVVPLSFHVDYFNKPWVDPFSDPDFSRREYAYNSVLRRDDLYFTPMMMVDGRYPMLGSNRPEAFKALKKALEDEPSASHKLTLGPEVKKGAPTLTVEARSLSDQLEGRDLMIGVAVTEGPIATKVPSGENAGATLVEPAIVRSFAFKKVKLGTSKPDKLTFPLRLAENADPAKTRVVGFVQDWDKGAVYQAESIPWVAVKAETTQPNARTGSSRDVKAR